MEVFIKVMNALTSKLVQYWPDLVAKNFGRPAFVEIRGCPPHYLSANAGDSRKFNVGPDEPFVSEMETVSTLPRGMTANQMPGRELGKRGLDPWGLPCHFHAIIGAEPGLRSTAP